MFHDSLKFFVVTKTLPSCFEVIRSESLKEGYRFIDRLLDEWNNGINRFNKPNEVLLYACKNDVIAGIGGLTIDPEIPDAMRMRRFYVASRVPARWHSRRDMQTIA